MHNNTGPDGITGRVLRSCADQLAGLFTSIFNEPLATSVVPTSFKKSIIIPVPKNNKPSCLNDYRPVALTSIVMKVFERLVKSHISSSIPVTLDPLQFAYRPNRSTDDAISHILHSSLTHIDSSNGNFARLLFISPFHTEIPENTRVMCSGICSRIVRFAAFTLPVIFRNMCVHSHTTRKDPVKTRDLSCDVYNARSPFH